MLRLSLILTLTLTLLGASQASAEKFNVVLIVSDDLNNDLGCYGHSLVQSPNLDRLAQDGIRFDQAYCQYPLCSPSRASFLTGRRPNNTGVLSNPGNLSISPHFREFIPNAVTLPQLFKTNGYFVARVGKLYHYNVPRHIGTDGLDDPESWDQTVNPRGVDKEREDQIFSLLPGQFGGTLSWLATGEELEHTDALSATAAIELIERNQDRPFFLAVGFFRPHTPYVAPQEFFDLYPVDKMPVAQVPEDHEEGVPAAAFGSHKKEHELLNDELRRQAVQAYYASTSLMDSQVGRLLDALDRLKLREKTIVVFFSDHGYHLGEHGLWQKRSLFEQSARVPLIISAPGVEGNGSATANPTELVDVYPTLAELCGLESRDELDGRSLVSVLSDPSSSVREAAFTQVDRGNFTGVSLRTDRWRYTEWDGGKRGVELYDHDNDPEEYHNLAESPDHTAILEQLREFMKEGWDPTVVEKQ